MTNRLTITSRKLISILAIVAMVITSISNISVHNNAYAGTRTAQVGSYTILVPDGASTNDASASTEVTKLDSSGSNTLSGGWYVFEGHQYFNNGLVIEGACNIILADGSSASISGKEECAGIQVSDGASLTIWSASQNTGRLTARGGKFAAGIGGGSLKDGSNITINGGNIFAFGGNGGAAIGGGTNGNGKNIRINDGCVTCYANNGYAIGGGAFGKGSNIVISKSKLVKAGTTEAKATVFENNGSDISDKIADGAIQFVSIADYTGNSDEKSISDYGVVNYAKRVGSYIIAVPEKATLPSDTSLTTEVNTIDSSSVNLTEGWYIVNNNVTVEKRIQIKGNVNIILGDGNTLRAARGIQVSGDDNSLTIWTEMGGTGKLISKANMYTNHNSGIGGSIGAGGNITINGGNITAYGDNGGAGIGGGENGDGSNITINDGKVTAYGDNCGAGIGGGYKGSGNNITITGGEVTAYGDYGGAGIGGGTRGSASQITIEGGKVIAVGSSNPKVGYNRPRGIGVGYGGQGASSIKISTSLVVEAGMDSYSLAQLRNDSDDYTEKLEPTNRYVIYAKYISIYPKDGWSNSTTLEATSIKSLKSYKKSIKVTWATETDVNGYQVLYKTTKSPTKHYKTVSVYSPAISQKTITNLKRHTRYYVKVRAFIIESDGTRTYSAWSKLKNVKTR